MVQAEAELGPFEHFDRDECPAIGVHREDPGVRLELDGSSTTGPERTRPPAGDCVEACATRVAAGAHVLDGEAENRARKRRLARLAKQCNQFGREFRVDVAK